MSKRGPALLENANPFVALENVAARVNILLIFRKCCLLDRSSVL